MKAANLNVIICFDGSWIGMQPFLTFRANHIQSGEGGQAGNVLLAGQINLHLYFQTDNCSIVFISYIGRQPDRANRHIGTSENSCKTKNLILYRFPLDAATGYSFSAILN